MVTLPVFPFFLRKRACPAYFGAFFSSGKLPVYYTLLLVVCQGFIGVKNVKARKNPLKREKARKKRLPFFLKYAIMRLMRVGGEAAALCTGNPL